MKLPQIEISVKLKGALKSDLKTISCSTDMYEVCKLMFDEGKIDWIEEMVLVCLNKANRVVGWYKVSQGGTSGTICDPKVVFTIALNCTATSIIIAHNHPSGSLKPSAADETLTQKIKAGGKLLDITLLDHIIITGEGYYSFADEGIL